MAKQENERCNEDRPIFKEVITRRKFLKHSAAAAAITGGVLAATSTGGSALKALAENTTEADASAKEQVFSGVCRSMGCSGNCLFDVVVRDGKIVKVGPGLLPDDKYNRRICLRGISHIQRTYSSYRLKYPMRRVGARGSGQWEQISWDTALTEITDKWKDCWAKYGKSSILMAGGSGNGGGVNGMGAVTWAKNVFHFTDFTMPHDQAGINYSMRALGCGPTYNGNEHADFVNSKCILIWGANVTEASVQSWRFIADAKERGAKLINVDISYSTIGAKSDIFVPVRPGTDAVLAMAMMQVVIEENLIDSDFIKKSTVGPFLVKETDGKYLRLSDLGPLADGQADDMVVCTEDGKFAAKSEVDNPVIRGNFEVNGISVSPAFELLAQRVAEYPPEKAEPICQVSADKIREITHIYVENSPSAIYVGFGVDHYTNGHYNVMSIYALAMITGNVGKSGAFTGISGLLDAFYANYGVFQDDAPVDENEVRLDAIPILQLDQVLKTGQWKGKPAVVKCLFCAQSNPIATSADTNVVKKLLDQFEQIVVADSIMTDSTQYADIVLPVAHWFEMDDVTIISPPFVKLQEKAIEPLYESKTDSEIFKLLAQRMGVGAKFQAISDLDFMREYLNSDALNQLGITLEALQEKKAMRISKDLMIYGAGGVFPTETGRLQFYLENAAPTVDYGQEWDPRKEQLPILFEPPSEAWYENPLMEKYPLSLYQEHTRWRVHTTWNRSEWLRELDPEPIVKINSQDAAPRGIKGGDIVKVYNDRGYVVLKAVINDGLRPGVVNIPKGWGDDQFIDGASQQLLTTHTNPVCDNTPCYDVLVNVVKM